MKKYLYAILCTAIIILSYFAYDYYREKEYIESSVPIVRDVSSRVSSVLSYEAGSQGITYDELMARLEAEVSAMGNTILQYQRMAADVNGEKADSILSYFESAQDLLRGQLSMTKAYLDWKVAMNLYGQDVDLYETLGVREIDRDRLHYAQETLSQSFEEVRRRSIDVHEAIKRFESSAMTLSDRGTRISRFISGDALVDASLLERVMKNVKERKAGFSSFIDYHKTLGNPPGNKIRN